MFKKTKQNEDCERPESEKPKSETEKAANKSDEQTKKSYYYDDAYGYEVYKPEDDDDSDN